MTYNSNEARKVADLMPQEVKLPPGKLQLTLMIKPSGTLTTRCNLTEKELVDLLDGTIPRNGYAVIPIVPNEDHVSETLHVWRQDIISYIIVVMGELKPKSGIVIPDLKAPADIGVRRS